MRKVIIIKTGEEVEVSNNIAHTMIDKGIAVLKGLDKPKKNKMMSLKRKKVNKKQWS